jgi:hypothetical protein
MWATMPGFNYIFNNYGKDQSQVWQLTLVNPSSQEAEIGRITV